MKKFITYIVIIALLSVSVLGQVQTETGNQGHPFSEIWPDDSDVGFDFDGEDATNIGDLSATLIDAPLISTSTIDFGSSRTIGTDPVFNNVISFGKEIFIDNPIYAGQFCFGNPNDNSCITSWPSADGSVTSVGISMPGEFSVNNSPITDDGVINVEWKKATIGHVFAAPSLCTDDCSPGFRLLQPEHIPSLDASKITSGVFSTDRIPNLAASKITSGHFSVNHGGTGRTSLTAGRILFGAGTNDVGLDSNLHWDNTYKRLGIGTYSPDYKLEVVGNIGAGSFIYRSDINLKENFKPLKDSLQKINQINTYEFNFINSTDKKMGVIAQEIEELFPNVVTTSSKGIKGVDYVQLVVPLVEAVKEQQNQIDELNNRLEKQQEQINKLLNR